MWRSSSSGWRRAARRDEVVRAAVPPIDFRSWLRVSGGGGVLLPDGFQSLGLILLLLLLKILLFLGELFRGLLGVLLGLAAGGVLAGLGG